jgi:hypothetical protein
VLPLTHYSRERNQITIHVTDISGVLEDNAYVAIPVILASMPALVYRKYKARFESRNKLFKHVYANSCLSVIENSIVNKSPQVPQSTSIDSSYPEVIIVSPTQSPMTSDIIGYKYATLSIKFTPDSEVFQICADTGCSCPLVDRKWLSQNLSARINMIKATIIKGIASV